MTPIAIVFLVLAGLLIWGGLAVSILLLRRDASEVEDVLDDHPGDHPGGVAGSGGSTPGGTPPGTSR
ncbi:methionine/alanine import family NSS transporter small subunit [Actinotalea sp. AC32]|nr:methionine/alanine import family NSS transporter small subunit [Actinotalea sp. AC32]